MTTDNTDAISEIVELTVKLAQEESKAYNHGEINNSFALGMSTTSLAHLLESLDLNKRQMTVIELKRQSLERQLTSGCPF